MEVLTKILQQGTEFDTLAETVLADRSSQFCYILYYTSELVVDIREDLAVRLLKHQDG